MSFLKYSFFSHFSFLFEFFIANESYLVIKDKVGFFNPEIHIINYRFYIGESLPIKFNLKGKIKICLKDLGKTLYKGNR